MSDKLLDMFKHSAENTLVQSRKDLEHIVKRMKALEGPNPEAKDCYPNVLVCLLNTAQRIHQVMEASHQMAMREATGIKPELN